MRIDLILFLRIGLYKKLQRRKGDYNVEETQFTNTELTVERYIFNYK